MGIFSTINYYIDGALDALGIGSGTDASKKSEGAKETSGPSKSGAKAKKPQTSEPVIQQNNVPENNDTIKINPKTRENQKQGPVNVRTRTAIQQSIQNKCVRYGIDGNKLLRELKKHSGMKDGDYEALSEAEKRELWTGIEMLVDSAVQQTKSKNLSENASLEDIIIETVKNIEKDVKSGNITDVKTIIAQADIVNNLLNSNKYKNLPKEEQCQYFNNIYKEWKQHKQEYIKDRLASVPESMRAQKLKELEELFNKAEMTAFSSVAATEDTETAFNAIRIVGPNNMANASKFIGRTRKNKVETQRFYNEIATSDNVLNLYCDYYDRGEKPDGLAVREMNTDLMANKSYEAVLAYQEGYLSARQSGKYFQMEQDGIFTEMAAGNLAGSQLNQNLSVKERTQFVKDFYNSEAQFGDLDTVVEKSNLAIQSYISENPQKADGLIKEVKEIQKNTEKHLTIALAKSNTLKKANQDVKNNNSVQNNKPKKPDGEFIANATFETGAKSMQQNRNTANFVSNTFTSSQKPLQKNTSIVTQGSSDAAIQMALSSGEITITEAVKQVKDNKKVYRILFANNSLLTKYEKEAVDFITQQTKVEDLVEMANSIKAIELIRTHNKVDDKEKLYAKLEQKATSIQKNMFKKENERYAAA